MVAAGVILPMTDNPKLSQRYGTRHRAAIGLSELHDGFCIVVSEETGHISAASRGMLVRYNSADELSEPLTYLYLHTVESSATSPIQSFFALFGKRPARDTAPGADQPVPSVVETAQPTEPLTPASEPLTPANEQPAS